MRVRNLVWPGLALAEAVIVCAGQLGEEGRKRLEASIEANIPLIAADGGLKHIKDNLEAIVGDLDSAGDHLGGITAPVHQDEDESNTDLVKVLKHVSTKNCSAVDVIGICGGSLGHQLAVIGAISSAGTSIDVCCVLEDGLLANIPKLRKVSGHAQPSFSVFAFGEPATISIEGAKWSLDHEVLTLSTLGARNTAVTDTKVTNHHLTPGLMLALDFNDS